MTASNKRTCLKKFFCSLVFFILTACAFHRGHYDPNDYLFDCLRDKITPEEAREQFLLYRLISKLESIPNPKRRDLEEIAALKRKNQELAAKLDSFISQLLPGDELYTYRCGSSYGLAILRREVKIVCKIEMLIID